MGFKGNDESILLRVRADPCFDDRFIDIFDLLLFLLYKWVKCSFYD